MYLRHLPPLSAQQLIWPVSLVGAWSAFLTAGAPASAAFVWAGVVAQSICHAQAMGTKVDRMNSIGGAGHRLMQLLVILPLCLAALQFWGFAPWFSQRILSGFILMLIALKLAALLSGDLSLTGRSPPKTPLHERFDRHVVQVQILVAVLAIAINEGMIVAATPLNGRIVVLALLPLAAHYLVWIITFITHPPLED